MITSFKRWSYVNKSTSSIVFDVSILEIAHDFKISITHHCCRCHRRKFYCSFDLTCRSKSIINNRHSIENENVNQIFHFLYNFQQKRLIFSSNIQNISIFRENSHCHRSMTTHLNVNSHLNFCLIRTISIQRFHLFFQQQEICSIILKISTRFSFFVLFIIFLFQISVRHIIFF